MSMLGRILLFLNVLAALGFFVVAGMDWGKRYQWAEAALEHRLVVDGLPLDDAAKDREGKPASKDLREDTVKKLFASAGGPPVHTQIEEVKRIKDELQKR